MKGEQSFPEHFAAAVELPVADPVKDADLRQAFDKGWEVIVWDDPINLMNYVVYVFQLVLHFDLKTARKHMLEVHHKGKSCVARDTREKAEHLLQQLQQRGLKVSVQKAS
ncbi:MAG: ATP-dependent Clp protease adaptor ClpS [Verrucomicrobiota bacterium]